MDNEKPLDVDALADLVFRMRTAQRSYFATRKPDVLEMSKKLERQVDRAVDRIRGQQTFPFLDEADSA